MRQPSGPVCRRVLMEAAFPRATGTSGICATTVSGMRRGQRRTDRGLARRLLWPFPRYVNSVLFLPQTQAPGG
jgi:hypothetical protein